MKVGIPSRYVRLGIDAAEREGLPAWTAVRRHYHCVPMNTWLHMPTDLDRVIRWELVTRAYRQPGDTSRFSE